MLEIINRISSKEFGTEPESMEAIEDKGVVNKVYKVNIKGDLYIFRLNSKGFLEKYLKEKYCIDKATEARVPVSTCYFVGIEGEYSYMILNYIAMHN